MHRADGRVVSIFSIQALAGEPITLYATATKPARFVSSATSSMDWCA
jgi:UDP-glucuronate decarboxylase